jgi:hypothetical protein
MRVFFSSFVRSQSERRITRSVDSRERDKEDTGDDIFIDAQEERKKKNEREKSERMSTLKRKKSLLFFTKARSATASDRKTLFQAVMTRTRFVFLLLSFLLLFDSSCSSHASADEKPARPGAREPRERERTRTTSSASPTIDASPKPIAVPLGDRTGEHKTSYFLDLAHLHGLCFLSRAREKIRKHERQRK